MEQPLTLFVTEGRRMVQVARDTGRIVQTGSQQRSDNRFHQACELARSIGHTYSLGHALDFRAFLYHYCRLGTEVQAIRLSPYRAGLAEQLP